MALSAIFFAFGDTLVHLEYSVFKTWARLLIDKDLISSQIEDLADNIRELIRTEWSIRDENDIACVFDEKSEREFWRNFFTTILCKLGIHNIPDEILIEFIKIQIDPSSWKLFDDVLEVLSILQSKNVKRGIISNAFPSSKNIFLHNNLEQYFDYCFWSYESYFDEALHLNSDSSENRFCQFVLKETGIIFNEVLFIDDRPRFVEEALKIGMQVKLVDRGRNYLSWNKGDIIFSLRELILEKEQLNVQSEGTQDKRVVIRRDAVNNVIVTGDNPHIFLYQGKSSVVSNEEEIKANKSPSQIDLNFKSKLTLDEIKTEIRSMVTDHRYPEAVAFYKNFQLEFSSKKEELIVCEINVWYAHAAMYLGRTSEAKELLSRVVNRQVDLRPQNRHKPEFRDWCIIFGRACNHIGYIYWMSLGFYLKAANEFKKAIGIFSQIPNSQELATAYDNLGRVYSLLGYFPYAQMLIERGMSIREELVGKNGNEYRLALSWDSLAQVCLPQGRFNQALFYSNYALEKFEEFYDVQNTEKHQRRGVGLALITIARSKRYLASLCYTKIDKMSKSNQKKTLLKTSIDLLADASKRLQEALEIFREVDEKSRLFQVENELGCVYREEAIIRKLENSYAENEAERKAIESFEQSLSYGKDTSTNEPLKIQYIDTLEDLAQLYSRDFRDGFVEINETTLAKFNAAKECLVNAMNEIPEEYRKPFDQNFINSIDEPREEFLFQLAKIYLLKAELAIFNNDNYLFVENCLLANGCISRLRELVMQSMGQSVELILPVERMFVEKIYSRIMCSRSKLKMKELFSEQVNALFRGQEDKKVLINNCTNVLELIN